MGQPNADDSCPCGSGKYFTRCCEPVISGSSPATSAEALMRSRFTAYSSANEKYLLESWHASTRPESIDPDPSMQWLRLKILSSDNNHVEFIATCRINGKAYKLHENSRFILEDGTWFYVEAVPGTGA